jgi:hypothetical protein
MLSIIQQRDFHSPNAILKHGQRCSRISGIGLVEIILSAITLA